MRFIWSIAAPGQAIGFPAASTIVETSGTSPSRICADSSATTSKARLNKSPIPPATGNINAAASSAANRQHPASLVTVAEVGARSDIPEVSAAQPRDCGECPQGIVCRWQRCWAFRHSSCWPFWVELRLHDLGGADDSVGAGPRHRDLDVAGRGSDHVGPDAGTNMVKPARISGVVRQLARQRRRCRSRA